MNLELHIIFGCLALVGATNYCNPALCYLTKHIACGHDGQFDPVKCPVGARLIDIKPQIDAILHNHNRKRNLIASGELKGFSPAVNMATMQWDDELANIASLNVMQCTMKHDECRSTDSYKYAGQNLGRFYYTGSESLYSDKFLISYIMERWFDEYKNCNMSDIDSLPGLYGANGLVMGHFTEMIVYKNIRLGCAASRFFLTLNTFLFACNYAASHFIGKPVYIASRKAATGCTKGVNPLFPSLCSIEEYYNPNIV